MRHLFLLLALLTTTLALPAQRGEGRRPRDEAPRAQRDDRGGDARAERREIVRQRVLRAVEEGRLDPQQVRERIRQRMQDLRSQRGGGRRADAPKPDARREAGRGPRTGAERREPGNGPRGGRPDGRRTERPAPRGGARGEGARRGGGRGPRGGEGRAPRGGEGRGPRGGEGNSREV